jgi:glycosyltransferase involved in cell wall biosynthesis
MPDRHPFHILSFAQSPDGGGVERAMLRLARGWAAAGCRVTLVLGSTGRAHGSDIPAGVDVIAANGSYLGLTRALPAAVRRAAPDIVFCPGNHYAGAAAWLKIRLGGACPPIVAKVSNRLDRDDQPFPLRQAYRIWLRAHPRFLDHMVAMTPAMAAETSAMTGIRAERLGVIANPPVIEPAGQPTPALDGDYLIGIGRLVPQKRWDHAIAAFGRTARRDTKLLIVGEGATRPMLERQIAGLGLSDRISLPGHAANPLPALAEARALVLTSDFEGVPGVLQEALAVGTPVVATESSIAIREIVTDPRLGSVVPVGDGDALVAAFDHWLEPGRTRPTPVPPWGADSVGRYIRLFEDVVSGVRGTA